VTAQINDLCRYQDEELSIAGISEGILFDPSRFGLDPVGTCTACWRGYQAIFAVQSSRLVLDTLHVNLPGRENPVEQVGPEINGVSPTGHRGDGDWFNNHYEGLGYAWDYTGGLLLATGFIPGLYVHMGFQDPWKYETVFELLFEKGALKTEHDRSERMAEIRQKMLDMSPDPSGEWPDESIGEFVARSFDRTYHL